MAMAAVAVCPIIFCLPPSFFGSKVGQVMPAWPPTDWQWSQCLDAAVVWPKIWLLDCFFQSKESGGKVVTGPTMEQISTGLSGVSWNLYSAWPSLVLLMSCRLFLCTCCLHVCLQRWLCGICHGWFPDGDNSGQCRNTIGCQQHCHPIARGT